MHILAESGSVGDIPLQTSKERKKLTEQNNNMDAGGHGLVMAGTLLVALLVVVNIIITAVILGRPSADPIRISPSSSNGGEAPATMTINTGAPGRSGGGITAANRTFLVAYGHDFGKYEYIDSSGFHRGLFRDLIVAVCEGAGTTCKPVYDKYTNVWTSEPAQHAVLGTGLQARYYDAGSGWYPTVERVHTAKFTTPFLTNTPSRFYWKPGRSFDRTDFSNKKFVFVEGWFSNEKCVARNYKGVIGVPITADQVVYVPSPDAMKDRLLNDPTVTAGFMDVAGMQRYVDMGILQDDASPETCTLAGGAMMSRMDSDFTDMWNRGFNKIQYNGVFKGLCEKHANDHAERGGTMDCVDAYNFEI